MLWGVGGIARVYGAAQGYEDKRECMTMKKSKYMDDDERDGRIARACGAA